MKTDRAWLMTAAGVLLLMPVFLNLVARDVLLWALPLEVIYLFTVWIGLIFAAFLFSREGGE